MEYFDKGGEKVEAFSKEDLEKKTTEAVDKYKEDNPSQAEELGKIKGELETTQASLKTAEETIEETKEKKDEGGDDKDGAEVDEQNKRLSKENKELKEALDKVQTGTDEKIDKMKEDMLSGEREKIFKNLVGDDKELRAKMELELDGFANKPTTAFELEGAMAKAYTLAKGETPAPGLMDGKASAGDKGDEGNRDTKQEESEKSKELRGSKALNISDADAEKFGDENYKPPSFDNKA